MSNSKFHSFGISINHIIIDNKTKEPIAYEENGKFSYILDELSSYYPDARFILDGPVNEFDTDKFSVIFNSDAALKINLFATDSVKSLSKTYSYFRDYLDEILLPMDLSCRFKHEAFNRPNITPTEEFDKSNYLAPVFCCGSEDLMFILNCSNIDEVKEIHNHALLYVDSYFNYFLELRKKKTEEKQAFFALASLVKGSLISKDEINSENIIEKSRELLPENEKDLLI